jgi:UDP-glucuronate decarboxylase
MSAWWTCDPADVARIGDGLGGRAERFANKTVILTGGRGFLGRYFAAFFAHLNQTVLASAPCRLVVLDNLITSGDRAAEPDPAPLGVEFHAHDVIQPFVYDQPVHYVLHAAGIASPFYYRKYPVETLEVAVWGTKNMLELARRNGAKLLFFSSSEIYGDPDPAHVPTPESYRGNVSCLGPRACYDESKRLGETLTRVYHDHFGVETTIVRPFNVYGPGMSESDYRVLPNFASRLKAGRSVRVYGVGTQTRTFCYVTDAVTGFLLALLDGVPGEAYNIGSAEPEVSMLDLVREIEGVLGRPVPLDRVEYPDSYPADEPMRRCPDLTKARLQLGYEARVPLRDGLGRFFDWTNRAYRGAP